MRTNDIRGGISGKVPAYVVCSWGNVHEISSDVANFLGRSADYFSIDIADLRCDENDREILKDEFPNLLEEAYRAIFNANVRGVTVEVFGYNDTRNKFVSKLIDLRNKLHVVECYDRKLIEKVNKVLRKNGETEIDLDTLFNHIDDEDV